MRFYKYHSCGNDYILFDCRRNDVAESEKSALTKRLGDRRTGIGGDGAVFVCRSRTADAYMRIFNADGSEAETCGTALRCTAKYLLDHSGARKRVYLIQTASGERTVIANCADFTVDMGKINFEASKFSTESGEFVQKALPFDERTIATLASVGNPHCVIFTSELEAANVPRIGEIVSKSAIFPRGTNVEFVEIVDERTIKMRVYERGSGETTACGSGSVAAVAAAIKSGNLSGGDGVRVVTKGGEVKVSIEGGVGFLTGDAVEAFCGEVEIEG